MIHCAMLSSVIHVNLGLLVDVYLEIEIEWGDSLYLGGARHTTTYARLATVLAGEHHVELQGGAYIT